MGTVNASPVEISEPFLDEEDKVNDDDGLENLENIPEWKDQITIRGLVVSALLGTLFCIITHKLNLTVGIIPSLNVAAGLLGFFFVKSWTSFLSKLGLSTLPFTKQENTVIQTCVVACYGLAFSGGFGSYMLSMNEKTYKLIGEDYPGNRAEDVKNPALSWMIGFMFVVSFLGLFSLVPLRKIAKAYEKKKEKDIDQGEEKKKGKAPRQQVGSTPKPRIGIGGILMQEGASIFKCRKIGGVHKEQHERTKLKLQQKADYNAAKANHGRRRVIFQPGDLVWVHLRKERFPEKRKSKLSPRGDGPFKVVKKVGDNAYVLELPWKYSVSATFNVEDLTLYEELDDSRSNPFQEGEDDEGSITQPQVPIFDGPIMKTPRVMTRRLEDM